MEAAFVCPARGFNPRARLLQFSAAFLYTKDGLEAHHQTHITPDAQFAAHKGHCWVEVAVVNCNPILGTYVNGGIRVIDKAINDFGFSIINNDGMGVVAFAGCLNLNNGIYAFGF